MIVFKLVSGDQFIYHDDCEFLLNEPLHLDAEKLHRVFYQYKPITQEDKDKYKIVDIPNKTNKIIEYGFTPMNTDPIAYDGVILINHHTVAYIGKIKEANGLHTMFLEYIANKDPE